MKTYKKPDGSLWAFEDDGSQDHLIASDMVPVTESEADVIRNPPLSHQEIINEKIKVMDAQILQRLNDMAKTLRFESIATAIAAASLPVGEYRQDDGAKLHLWAARTWKKAEEVLIAFLSGQRDEPKWDQVAAELPTYPIE